MKKLMGLFWVGLGLLWGFIIKCLGGSAVGYAVAIVSLVVGLLLTWSSEGQKV